MTEKRKQMWGHIALVAAAAFLLISATIAWFMNSLQASTAPMTFAAQSNGAGASLYEAEKLENRVCAVPEGGSDPVLTQTVTFRTTPTQLKDQVFTVSHMVPGQAEYFLIELTGGTAVALKSVTLTDEAGNEITEPADGMLAKCLGLYFLPLNETQARAALAGTAADYALTLSRAAAGDPLEAARFSGAPLPVAGTVLTGDTAATCYVMALFYDPWYQQPLGTQTTTGTVSFSLAAAAAAGT